MTNYHVTIHGADQEAMANLVRTHHVSVIRQTLTTRADDHQVSAIADETTIRRLEAAGYRVERHEDVDETAQESLRDVGQGNRFIDQAGGPL
jgi:hypothetical protein